MLEIDGYKVKVEIYPAEPDIGLQRRVDILYIEGCPNPSEEFKEKLARIILEEENERIY